MVRKDKALIIFKWEHSEVPKKEYLGWHISKEHTAQEVRLPLV